MPAQQRPGRFPRLTLRGGIFLATGAGLLLLALLTNERDLLFVAGLLLAIPVAAVGYVSIRPVRLRITRMLHPPVVPAGGEVVVGLSLRNLSSKSVSGLRVRDTVRGQGTADRGRTIPAGTPLPALDRYEGGSATGADSVRFEYRFTPPRRGLYSAGPVLIGRTDPFGLASGEWALGEPHDLVVTPRVTPLAGRGLTGASNDGDVPERLRRLHHNADPLIARQYQPGDPLRRVNWAATARRGEIMVRQEEEQSNPGARLVLDTALRGRREQGTDTTTGAEADAPRLEQAFEVAVELAASVGVHLLDAGYRLDLIVLGPNRLGPGLSSRTSSSRTSSDPADLDATRPVSSGGLRGDPPAVFQPPGGAAPLLEVLARVEPERPPELWENGEGAPAWANSASVIGEIVEPPAAGEPGKAGGPGEHGKPGEQGEPGRPGEPGAPETGATGATGRRRVLSVNSGLLPTFSVLVAVDSQDVVELVNLASRSRPAVAFVLDTVDVAAVRRLREAGWRCIGLRTARDITRAWEEFIGERRRVHDAV